jgi:hypothetical protein
LVKSGKAGVAVGVVVSNVLWVLAMVASPQ